MRQAWTDERIEVAAHLAMKPAMIELGRKPADATGLPAVWRSMTARATGS